MPPPALRILFVEDSKDDVELARLALRHAGRESESLTVEDRGALDRALATGDWDVILVDHSLPHLSSIDVLALVHAARVDAPVIIVSGQIGEEAAVAAMQQGAVGYVPKDRLGLLAGAIDRALLDKRERATRRRAEAERDGFFHLSLDMLAILDEHGAFKVLNPAWESTLGYAATDLQGHSFLDFVHPDDRARMETQTRALDGPSAPVECRVRRLDGEIRWLLWAATRSREHHVIYAVAHDVTARKQAEAALVSSRVARPLVKKILLSVFEATGANASVLLRLGQDLAMEGVASDVDSFCRAYEEMGLGSLRLDEANGTRYVFSGENLFERTPGSRSTTCHLALGFLSGIVSRVNDGRPSPGAEVTCESRGDAGCRFVVQVKDAPQHPRDAEAAQAAASSPTPT